VLGILIYFNKKQGILKWACGYLCVPVAKNIAREEILLDTAALDEARNNQVENQRSEGLFKINCKV